LAESKDKKTVAHKNQNIILYVNFMQICTQTTAVCVAQIAKEGSTEDENNTGCRFALLLM